MKHRKEPPGDKNIIGVRVVAIRKAKGMKQKEFLARLQTAGLDISPTSLSRLEGSIGLSKTTKSWRLPKRWMFPSGNCWAKNRNEATAPSFPSPPGPPF